MISKAHRWKKRVGISIVVLLGAVTVAIAAIPDLRQGLALLWIFNANSFATDEWTAEAASASLAFRHDRHILVPVTVQGERAITIALDTGAPMTALIGGPHMDGLEFSLGRTVPIGGSGEGVSPTAQVVNDLQLAIGAVEYSDLTALLIPWEHMGEYFISPDQVYIHGILGYDLFSRYVVELDFQNERLTLHQPEHFQYDGTGEVVSLGYDGRKPYFEASVVQHDGSIVPTRLHLDLGKPTTLSLIPSDDSGISIPPGALPNESRGLSGKVEERISRIRELRLGNQVLKDVVTTFSIAGHATSGERHGVIGVDALSRFRLFVDYTRDHIILEPVDLDRPFESDMSGITWVPQGDGFAVWQVRDESPADAAGLRKGDKLVAIDDVEASRIRFSELFERMRAEAGAEIALELQRGSESLSVVLTLRRRI